jgi:hypothetical protein
MQGKVTPVRPFAGAIRAGTRRERARAPAAEGSVARGGMRGAPAGPGSRTLLGQQHHPRGAPPHEPPLQQELNRCRRPPCPAARPARERVDQGEAPFVVSLKFQMRVFTSTSDRMRSRAFAVDRSMTAMIGLAEARPPPPCLLRLLPRRRRNQRLGHHRYHRYHHHLHLHNHHHHYPCSPLSDASMMKPRRTKVTRRRLPDSKCMTASCSCAVAHTHTASHVVAPLSLSTRRASDPRSFCVVRTSPRARKTPAHKQE